MASHHLYERLAGELASGSRQAADRCDTGRTSSADARAQTAADRGRAAAAAAAAAALFTRHNSLADTSYGQDGHAGGGGDRPAHVHVTPLTEESLRRHVRTPPASPLAASPSLSRAHSAAGIPPPSLQGAARFDPAVLPFHCAEEYAAAAGRPPPPPHRRV